MCHQVKMTRASCIKTKTILPVFETKRNVRKHPRTNGRLANHRWYALFAKGCTAAFFLRETIAREISVKQETVYRARYETNNPLPAGRNFIVRHARSFLRVILTTMRICRAGWYASRYRWLDTRYINEEVTKHRITHNSAMAIDD